MDLTAKQRTIKSPESTEDVPRAKQIIRMEGGKAMSIPKTLIEEARKYKSATIGDIETKKLVKPSTKSDSDIPEGYFKNAFGEIVKNPSNKKGGFIRNPFAKPEPKRLFAGENSAQPPK